jgi:hypothetical protein
MADHILRDASGRQVGSIHVDSSGRQTGRDASGRQVGTYDSRSNTTRDSSGRTVGEGNFLSYLMKK